MKTASLFLSALLAFAAPLHAQSLPGDSVYHLQATTQDANGAPVGWASLRGQPRLVSMFYTHCHLMCPLIIENAKSVQKQLSPQERAKLGVVMLSLDPARDTPDAMREVALRHRVPGGWQFLTPADNDVRAIASVLDVRYRFRDDGSINHTSVLVLLDAEGRVRARSEVTAAAADPAFLIQIKALLAGP
ncbi:SCO family protein [Pseudoxanthomonas sp. Root630]|uniref:SCO family protein n=1 Tax=Pseudoxanthomonas sp. Root630 TaxID=1736574 RepID=UPI0007028F2F|nr:SCO family protein [Pseudoxanthomonas sp. Root630]KRA45233.1 electron transporter SenC [Pseudoxanthomonas sp. Root630]